MQIKITWDKQAITATVNDSTTTKKLLILFFTVASLMACQDETARDEPVRREMPINQTTLYEKSIREIDKTYHDGGVIRVLIELKRRALTGDKKALHRLFAIAFVSDGYVSEGVFASLAEIYRAKPEFVLIHVYDYEPAQRDLIYQVLLHEEYMGLFFEERYPTNISQLRSLGEKSQRFLQLYEYYLKHPRDIEDWSKTPPYRPADAGVITDPQ